MKKSGKIALACAGAAALAAVALIWKKEHERVHERHEKEIQDLNDVLGNESPSEEEEGDEPAETGEKKKPVSMPTQILKTIWHSTLPVFGEEEDLMKVYSNFYYEPDRENYSDDKSYEKALEYWEAKYDKLTIFDHSLHVLLVKDPNHSGTKYLRFMFRIKPYHRYGDPTLRTYHTFMKDFAVSFWERNKLNIGEPHISNELWAGKDIPVYGENAETGNTELIRYEVSQFKLQTEDYSDYSDNPNDAMSKMASAFHGFKTSLENLQKSGEGREDWNDLGLYVCVDFQVRRGGKKTDFDILMAIKFLQEFIDNGQFEVSKLVFHPGSDLGVFLDPESGYDENIVMLFPE